MASPDNNLGPAVVIVAWIFSAIAIAVVFTRYYIRLKIVRKTTIDDWLILLTLVSSATPVEVFQLEAHKAF